MYVKGLPVCLSWDLEHSTLKWALQSPLNERRLQGLRSKISLWRYPASLSPTLFLSGNNHKPEFSARTSQRLKPLFLQKTIKPRNINSPLPLYERLWRNSLTYLSNSRPTSLSPQGSCSSKGGTLYGETKTLKTDLAGFLASVYENSSKVKLRGKFILIRLFFHYAQFSEFFGKLFVHMDFKGFLQQYFF